MDAWINQSTHNLLANGYFIWCDGWYVSFIIILIQILYYRRNTLSKIGYLCLNDISFHFDVSAMRRIQLAIVCIILYLISSLNEAAAVEEIISYEKVSPDFVPLIALLISSATTLASTSHMGYILLVVLKVILVVGTYGIVRVHGPYIFELFVSAIEYYAKLF